MPKYNLVANKKLRKSKIKKTTTPVLERCPQRKGNCQKIFLMSPRKPNSAARRVANVIIVKSLKIALAYCPGIGHTLQRFSNVLIRGGRAKDLPGVKYKLIRGKFDLKAVHGRMQGRSKYGTFKRWM